MQSYKKSASLWLWPGLLAAIFLLALAACSDGRRETAVDVPTPTPTVSAAPTRSAAEDNFVVVATDAPNAPFTEFDAFGNLSGFIQRLMAEIAATAGLEYEFVVTPHEGVLQTLAGGNSHDFDAVVSNLLIPDAPRSGVAYTEPFLEVGQVMVVLVDENRIQQPQDVLPEMIVGVEANNYGEQAARRVLGLNDAQIDARFNNSIAALQALINEEITAVIIESYTANYFTTAYPDRLKIVGGNGRDAWISSRAYGIAVAANNPSLLNRFNNALAELRSRGALDRLVVDLLPDQQLQPGESRAGTAPGELTIGILGELDDLDPASLGNLISWELKANTMGGLYRITGDNTIEPLLAAAPPIISEDKLEYTIALRQDIRFGDGSELTAEDVKWSIDRARSLGNFLVNSYLKDSNDDGFADDDAVQVLDDYTLRFVLQAPTGYFLSLLATPPYFPVSNECFALTWDLQSTCGGVGPYTIMEWIPGEQLRLRANPEWPERPSPAFENVVLRFFSDVESMRNALERFRSIDIAWTGFPYELLSNVGQQNAEGGTADFTVWEGPVALKSYLMFNHDTAPWDRERVRQAAAYALDREALAALFDGARTPLYSPVPETVPGHTAVFPQTDLAQARSLLLFEGYSASNPLNVDLWYVSDGRYSAIEEAYATAIKEQLEATGVFQVTLQSAPFETLRASVGACEVPFYLLGWPTPGSPTNYLDATSWTDFFIINTGTGFCSNYESEEMEELRQAALEETDAAARLALYEEMQQLWAEELPTLDLLQERRFAVSQPGVSDVVINALGLLHYELLTK